MGLESRIQRLENRALQSSRHVVAILESPGDQFRVDNRNFTVEEFELFKANLPKNCILHILKIGF